MVILVCFNTDIVFAASTVSAIATIVVVDSTDSSSSSSSGGGGGGGSISPAPISEIKEKEEEEKELEMLEITVSRIDETSVTVIWKTNILSRYNVALGIDEMYALKKMESVTYATEHSVLLTDLVPTQQYWFRITMFDNKTKSIEYEGIIEALIIDTPKEQKEEEKKEDEEKKEQQLETEKIIVQDEEFIIEDKTQEFVSPIKNTEIPVPNITAVEFVTMSSTFKEEVVAALEEKEIQENSDESCESRGDCEEKTNRFEPVTMIKETLLKLKNVVSFAVTRLLNFFSSFWDFI